jgi:hypothetical protein
MFFEPELNRFVLDNRAGVVDAPKMINVMGRHPEAENARINGVYNLCGVHAGRPLYYQNGVGVIKYSPKTDGWLIDCDGLAQPGLLTRLLTRIVTGDADAAYDKCSAWAYANGSSHPGNASLQWNVWNNGAQRHHLDRHVVATSAPVSVNVCGRDERLENADINGDYDLAQFYEARPVYEKAATHTSPALAMYFSLVNHTWVIDRNLCVRDSGTCVAYMDGSNVSDHPALNKPWKVFETARGDFNIDARVSVEEGFDLPSAMPSAYLPNPEHFDAFVGAQQQVGGQGMKRGYGMDSLAQSPQPKQARLGSQGGGWLRDTSRRLFGA